MSSNYSEVITNNVLMKRRKIVSAAGVWVVAPPPRRGRQRQNEAEPRPTPRPTKRRQLLGDALSLLTRRRGDSENTGITNALILHIESPNSSRL